VFACLSIVYLVWGSSFLFTKIAVQNLPPALFAKRTFNTAVAFGMCVNLTYYGMVFVLSLYLQRVLGHTPLEAGLAFLPLTFSIAAKYMASWMARCAPSIPWRHSRRAS